MVWPGVTAPQSAKPPLQVRQPGIRRGRTPIPGPQKSRKWRYLMAYSRKITYVSLLLRPTEFWRPRNRWLLPSSALESNRGGWTFCRTPQKVRPGARSRPKTGVYGARSRNLRSRLEMRGRRWHPPSKIFDGELRSPARRTPKTGLSGGAVIRRLAYLMMVDAEGDERGKISRVGRIPTDRGQKLALNYSKVEALVGVSYPPTWTTPSARARSARLSAGSGLPRAAGLEPNHCGILE